MARGVRGVVIMKRTEQHYFTALFLGVRLQFSDELLWTKKLTRTRHQRCYNTGSVGLKTDVCVYLDVRYVITTHQ